MAKTIMMVNPNTGVIKKGFYGFSWTTLFFGGFPAIFRGDLMTGLIVFVLNAVTVGIAGIIWAFVYNKKYTLGLIDQGYRFAPGVDDREARRALGIIPDAQDMAVK